MDSANDAIADAINSYFSTLYDFIEMLVRRFCTNFYKSFAEVTAYRWTKVGLSVVGYILIRPYIEALFKKMHERDRKKQKEKELAEAAARGNKKAKMSANVLRGGNSTEGEGRVLGEVENTDDEVEGEDAEEFAAASGVPEWGKNARKRAKKNQKKLEREAVENPGPKLTEEQLMELLDWSESEDEKKQA
ncbi:trafficking PGA2-domain-containing protein [Aspergillus egyptiacus]|nr:trafficking PGA2-domain-containing protein [Aspergillus egyptiacus]